MTLAPGTKLGPYEILAPLGAGGMGEVWKAKDTRLDRFVAVKVLPEHLAKNPEALARFGREAKAVAALNHPNITGIHDLGREGETSYAVMELLEGESLRTRLGQGPIAPRKATELAIQMAQGLAAAHEKGVVHRDLKPDNLWITKEGRLKILDFGLAKQLPAMGTTADSLQPTAAMSPGHQTEEGVLLGTLGYMSPEQVRGERVDARSDIFSFGVVLFEMLTGKRAFARDTAADTLAAILKEEVPELETSGRQLPPGLQRALEHCLEKAAPRRFQNAQDLAFALENVLGNASAGTAPSQWIRPGTWPRPWLTAILLAGVAILGVLGGWWGRPPKDFPTWTQLTYRRGTIHRARFTPDGQSAVYSASWGDKSAELFLARLDGKATRPLGLSNAWIMGVNGQGDMLLILRNDMQSGSDMGTLALMPLEGGTPRELFARVKCADFGPDGKDVMAIHQPVPGGPQRLDFPLGKTLFELETPSMDFARVSPKGDCVAVSYFDVISSTQVLALVDRQGNRREVRRFSFKTENELLESGPIWSPDGCNLVVSSGTLLQAVDLKGRIRVLGKDSGFSYLFDVSSKGRILRELVKSEQPVEVRRDGKNMDLSVSIWNNLLGLSADGSQVALQVGGSVKGTLVRKTNGSPPKLVDSDWVQALSPDGKWVATAAPGVVEQFNLVPTGLGATRVLQHPGWAFENVQFTGDGRHVLVTGKPTKGRHQYLRLPLDGGPPEVLPAEVSIESVFSSKDGRHLLVLNEQHRPVLRPLEGGPDQILAPALGEGESLVGWDLADRILIRRAGKPASVPIDLLDLRTGTRKLWQVVGPADPTLVTRINDILVSTDFKTLVYTYRRVITSDLFVLDGIQ